VITMMSREKGKGDGQGVMGNTASQLSRLDVDTLGGDDDANVGEEGRDGIGGGWLSAKARIILGTHNIFITIPHVRLPINGGSTCSHSVSHSRWNGYLGMKNDERDVNSLAIVSWYFIHLCWSMRQQGKIAS